MIELNTAQEMLIQDGATNSDCDKLMHGIKETFYVFGNMLCYISPLNICILNMKLQLETG